MWQPVDMLEPAIVFYDVVLFVHVLAVVLAFGVTFAYPFMDVAARRGHISDLAALHRFQVFLTRHLITPAMVVVLVAGVYLASDGANGYDFQTSWVGITFVILIVLFGLVGAVLTPAERRMAELAERDLAGGTGQLSADYMGQLQKMRIAGGAATLLVVAAVFLMVTKPGGV